jgi:hypothetical protein
MMDNIKVCKVWERLIRRQRSLNTELDLSAVGLETVTNLEADTAHNHPNQMFQLKTVKWYFKPVLTI